MNATMTQREPAGEDPPVPPSGLWADADAFGNDPPPGEAVGFAGDDADGTMDTDALQAVLPDPLPRLAIRSDAATDAQLQAWIEAVAAQDERALAALYDATFSRVFGLVRRIVRNAALAEEVVEDAYFQVWRQAVRFDPVRGAPVAWLLAIARTRAIDLLRREARVQHEPLDDDTARTAVSPEAAADELLALARHRSDLEQALMLLGAQPRQLVSMAFFRGLSHEEIALQTHLPLGTVKSQIRRALLTLRQILANAATPAMAS